MNKIVVKPNRDLESNFVLNNTLLKPGVRYEAIDAQGNVVGTKITDQEGKRWSEVSFEVQSNASLSTYEYNGDTDSFILRSGLKIFTSPSSKIDAAIDLMSEGDILIEVESIAPPVNLSAIIISQTQVQLSWESGSDGDELGFYINRSQSFKRWEDVADDSTIEVDDKIYYNNILYNCTAQYNVGTPKSFNASNFEVEEIVYTRVGSVNSGIETYTDSTGVNETSFQYMVEAYVSTSQSSGNPTIIATTEQASANRSASILALANLWGYWKFDDVGGAITDYSGNNRSLSVNGVISYEQSGLETSEENKSVYLPDANDNEYLYRDTIWNIAQDWEVAVIEKIPPVGAKSILHIKNYGGNGELNIRTQTGSPYTKINLFARQTSNNAIILNQDLSLNYSDNVTKTIFIRYDASENELQIIRASIDKTIIFDTVATIDLSLITPNGFTFGSDRTNALPMRIDNSFIVAGSFLTDQERIDIVNKGAYV